MGLCGVLAFAKGREGGCGGWVGGGAGIGGGFWGDSDAKDRLVCYVEDGCWREGKRSVDRGLILMRQSGARGPGEWIWCG